MDVPAEVLEELKCGECETYLSRSPVYLEHGGAAACGRCFSPKRPATRNRQYEALAKLARFPCKNQDLGCRETVAFADEGQDVAHEAVCKYRQYVCPVLGSSRCDWLGPRSQILQHCRAQHPDRVLDHPCRLTHDITTSSLHNYVLQAFHLLFLLHTKVCVATSKIYYSVRLLDASDLAQNFIFTLNIKRSRKSVTTEGDVAVQGCLALQEPTALALDVNSLLSVLGGWDGATFTVAVERQRLTKETCAGCGALTGRLYRDEGGWRCERCAPARRACENQAQGCTHQDFPSKYGKHERSFCQQRTSCIICEKGIPRGTLAAHYASAHRDVTHSAGATWRATSGIGLFVGCCLVTCPAGTALCRYDLDDSRFALHVRIPVPSERLCEFRCEVRVTRPATGLTHTYTPDINYKDWNDWRIEINEQHFPTWSRELDICVDISRV